MTAIGAYICYDEDIEVCTRACSVILSAQEQYSNTPPRIIGDSDFAIGIAAYHLRDENFVSCCPLVGGDGRFSLVADIAIYNRSAFIARLGMAQRQAGEFTDAALLLAGWERWGADCLHWLNADFAIALWDRDEKALFLARDFLGQRPLFYHLGKHMLAVASMPSGIHAIPEVPKAPNCTALADFVGLASPSDRNWFFEGIQRVLPGTVLRLRLDRYTETKIWPPPRKTLKLRGPAQYAEATQEVFDRAVDDRLTTAQDTGCFLSGGLDSGAVVASVARRLSDEARVTALTAAPPVDFDESRHSALGRIFDESPLAAATASLYPNVDHVIVPSNSKDLTSRWDLACQLFQVPMPNPTNFTWGADLCDAARDHGVKRILSGQMGNFSFSYDGGAYIANLLASGHVLSLFSHIAAARMRGRSWQPLLRQELYSLMPTWVLRSWARWKGRPMSMRDIHFGKDPFAGLPEDALFGQRERNSWTERLNVIRTADYGVYNKGLLAGWGLDLRDPTADRDLVELCLAIPDWVYQHDGRPRALARTMLIGRLPDHVLAENRRGFQGADWRRALWNSRDSLNHEIRRAHLSLRAEALLNLGRLETTLKNFEFDVARNSNDEYRLRYGLLRAVSAAHFIRISTSANH